MIVGARAPARVPTIIRVAGGNRGACRGTFKTYSPCLDCPSAIDYDASTNLAFVVTSDQSIPTVVQIDFVSSSVHQLPGLKRVRNLRYNAVSQTLLCSTVLDTVIVYSLRDHSATLLAGRERTKGFDDGQGEDATFAAPDGVLMIKSGSLAFVADSENHAIRSLAVSGPRAGSVVTVAGAGIRGHVDGVFPHVLFEHPSSLGLSLDKALLLIGERGSLRAMQLTTGVVRTLTQGERFVDHQGYLQRVSSFNNIRGITVAACGTIFCTDTAACIVYAISPDLSVAEVVSARSSTSAASVLRGPVGVAACASGGILLSDCWTHSLRLIPGAFLPPPIPYRARDHRDASPEIRAIALTLLVLARGQSVRLRSVAASGGLRPLLNAGLERLCQFIQIALHGPTPIPYVFEQLAHHS
eukprot:c5576_g1_i1.p1 GENE.c5576_g1_i1~~c5576_g1_i1.p1  ORF type:complete len:412 (-),score=46.68 c5576_g1_i1:56-1291(-)